jgi:hypothetical protein
MLKFLNQLPLVLLSLIATLPAGAEIVRDFQLGSTAQHYGQWSPIARNFGEWRSNEDAVWGSRTPGSRNEAILIRPDIITRSGNGESFLISVDAGTLSESTSHFVGIAFNVQPNGDCYVLRFSASNLVQLIRRTDGDSTLLSQGRAPIDLGVMARLTVRSNAPGVFDWTVVGTNNRPTSGTARDENNPLTGGLGGVYTNTPTRGADYFTAFREFLFTTQPETFREPRGPAGSIPGAPSPTEIIAARAAEDADQDTFVSAWVLTWRQDPTTTQLIDWHQAGRTASVSKPFAWRQVGAARWIERAPDEVLLFPHSSRYIHRLELTGLTPNTLYEFRIGNLEPLRFKTLPANLDDPLTFAVGGDMMGSPDVYERLNRVVAEADAAFVVWGGDLAYTDGDPNRVAREFLYFDILSRSFLTAERRVLPIIVGIGNHEVAGGFYWNTRFGNEWPGTDEARMEVAPFFFGPWGFPGQPGYGVIDIADYASIVILDTDHANPIAGAQTEWLEGVLNERRHVTHLLPVYHVPGFPTVRSFNGRVERRVREHWVPLFDAHGLRIAFEHHDHVYKRTHPLRGEEIHPDGMIFVGDGAWGVGTRTIGEARPYQAKTAERHHAFLVRLTRDRADLVAIDPRGEVFDRFSVPGR